MVAIGKGPSGLMILESKQEGKLIWVSADGVYLVKKDGRLFKLKGLEIILIDYVNLTFKNLLKHDNKAIYI